MNESRTFRLLRPITVGSALVGVSLFIRSDGLSVDQMADRGKDGTGRPGDSSLSITPPKPAPLEFRPFPELLAGTDADHTALRIVIPVETHRASKSANKRPVALAAKKNADGAGSALAALPAIAFGPATQIATPNSITASDAGASAVSGRNTINLTQAIAGNTASFRQPIMPRLAKGNRDERVVSRAALAPVPSDATDFSATKDPIDFAGIETLRTIPPAISLSQPLESLAVKFSLSTELAIALPETAEPAAEETVAVVTDPVETGSATSSNESLARAPVPAAASLPLAVAVPPEATAIPAAAASTAVAAEAGQDIPGASGAVIFDYDDELILQVRVEGTNATETIIAYGTRQGVYLPIGELSRLLDLAIRVSDDGNYASGWFLSEERTLTVDLRQGILTTVSGTQPLPRGAAQAFDGELFLRTDIFATLLPLEIEPDLRSQAVNLKTLEPFPFEERIKRRAARTQLNSRANADSGESWPRQETPFLLASLPLADIELRAVSDTGLGSRAEADVRLAGDLAYMTAQAYLTGSSRDGLTAALIELGRRDPDGDLLGPLQATEFQIGDVATTAMPLGLRGTAGRGAYVTNQPLESVSVFDQIDLRGVLQDGYEVELFRNNILLGSTREAVNGQYEFLQIPVDFGLNVFRLVFYGPQGQRREEVRRVSVGDGRLSPGQLVYTAGAVERGVNLLGVRGPNFRPDQRFGDAQAVGEVAYGINSDITAIGSAAFFEDDGEQKWLATAGVRTGLGGFAVRADVGASDGDGKAFGLGLGGRALSGSFSLSHFEYRGEFVDEVRGIGREPLRRGTDLDFNTTLELGGLTTIPVSFRARRLEYADGRRLTTANARSSVRFPGIIASNTISYTDLGTAMSDGFTQLAGSLDISTLGRSRTQTRGAVGYRILPETRITQVGAQVSYGLDDRTAIRGSAAYGFDFDDLTLGLSAIRKFDRFTAALDSQYAFGTETYSIALRIGFSLGRDPLRGRIFAAPPGWSSSGAVAVRAFQDLDGDEVFGPGDTPLEDVSVLVSSNTAQTDAQGFARLGELGSGNRAVVQIDPSSLPDILLAPVSRSIEIVPRPGRFHIADFPIMALSEIEGTVTFAENDSARGVSGLRLQLLKQTGVASDTDEENVVRTERGGYFFFERVKPGTYSFIIDPDQAERLNLCLAPTEPLVVPPTGDILQRNLTVSECAVSAPE